MARKIVRLVKKANSMIVAMMGMSPPKEIPAALLDGYTMSGNIEVKKLYFNDVGLPLFPRVSTKGKIRSFLRKIENREVDHYALDERLYEALGKYSIKGKDCVVMGSGSAFYESVCLYFGGRSVTTIEYNKLIYFHPRIKTMTPAAYERNPVQFDVGISMSSFEHDGLGRYGDALNPEADLEAMKRMRTMLKKGGILFLSIPIGKDLVVWNAHRVYGGIRLPLLLKDWEIVATFGYDENKLISEKNNDWQPVFVLRNT